MNLSRLAWFALLNSLLLYAPPARPEAIPVTKVYPVHYADLQETLEIITAMMPPTNGLRMAGGAGKLAVTGTEEQHRFVAELSGILKNGTARRIQFTGAATEVTVRDGETGSIGGFTENQDFYSRFLVGGSRDEKTYVMEITADTAYSGIKPMTFFSSWKRI